MIQKNNNFFNLTYLKIIKFIFIIFFHGMSYNCLAILFIKNLNNKKFINYLNFFHPNY